MPNTNNPHNQAHLKSVTIEQAMAICANCYHEFNKGDKAYIDKDADYICETCAEKTQS